LGLPRSFLAGAARRFWQDGLVNQPVLTNLPDITAWLWQNRDGLCIAHGWSPGIATRRQDLAIG
jgi:hypothetical protein